MLSVVLTGLTPYDAAHALQERLVDDRRAGLVPDLVLLLEHAETITLGRRPADDAVVNAGGVPVVKIERGGFATWHGPGQLVAYPIVALDGERRDVHAHLRAMEDALIVLLAEHGVVGERDERNTGVWVGGQKVASIGIAIRQWVSWHGLALNVHNDLGGFARIRPCGFDADVMTRLADHLDPVPPLEAVRSGLERTLAQALAQAVEARWTGALPDLAAVDRTVEGIRGAARAVIV